MSTDVKRPRDENSDVELVAAVAKRSRPNTIDARDLLEVCDHYQDGQSTGLSASGHQEGTEEVVLQEERASDVIVMSSHPVAVYAFGRKSLTSRLTPTELEAFKKRIVFDGENALLRVEETDHTLASKDKEDDDGDDDDDDSNEDEKEYVPEDIEEASSSSSAADPVATNPKRGSKQSKARADEEEEEEEEEEETKEIAPTLELLDDDDDDKNASKKKKKNFALDIEADEGEEEDEEEEEEEEEDGEEDDDESDGYEDDECEVEEPSDWFIVQIAYKGRNAEENVRGVIQAGYRQYINTSNVNGLVAAIIYLSGRFHSQKEPQHLLDLFATFPPVNRSAYSVRIIDMVLAPTVSFNAKGNFIFVK